MGTLRCASNKTQRKRTASLAKDVGVTAEVENPGRLCEILQQKGLLKQRPLSVENISQCIETLAGKPNQTNRS